ASTLEFGMVQHNPEALARERRYGGIVSLQAAQPDAHWFNAFVTAIPQRSASSLTLRACVALPLQFGMVQHKPEALARERRYGGIVSLQAAQPDAHWINAFVTAIPQGSASSLTLRASVEWGPVLAYASG
ncbi:MAG TPA: hypothetical protein VHX65_05285, partial [Pirellulales bacterium]|nr:hypothetical protein [Pirellulales bacterium]